MTIYLIDYENVHDGGLKDSENVPEDSKILLFFSNNEDKITMGNLMPIVSRLSLYKTRAGKQSLDMHLASYLGHEIGINGKEHKYVIVSKDHDYDNVAMYWKDQGIDVSVQGALVPAVKQEPEKDRQAQEQSQSQNQNQSRSRTQNNRNRNQNQSRNGWNRRQPENSTAEQPAQPVQPEVPIMSAPSAEVKITEEEKLPAENIISAEENIPVKEVPEEEKKPEETTVPDTVTAEEISEKEKTPEETVPHARNNRSRRNQQNRNQTAKAKPTEKTMLNNKMMTKLTEAKLDAATVGKLTATIMKQFGKNNFRQLAYREIIKACGMQRGLEVYGLVKKIL